MLYHRYQEQEAQQCQPEQCQDQSHDHALDQYEDPYLGHYLDQQLDHRLQVREEVNVTQQEEEYQSEEEEPVEDAPRPIQHHVQFQPGLQRRYQEVSAEVISVVSVSSFPDALEFIVNAVIDHARGKYVLEFVGNAISVDAVRDLLEDNPHVTVLFAASTWSTEEQREIFAEARRWRPDIKIFAVPPNLHVEIGGMGVISYLQERVDEYFGW